MNSVQVLDCTLRDGGYCNAWNFGYSNIKKVMANLVAANIDIIECGFLTNKILYDKECSRYTTLEEIADTLPENRDGKLFVAMINYGEYDIADIRENDKKSVDGFRVAFHKKDAEQAIKYCEAIQQKGYKVFIQPMVSMCYSDEEFLTLIHAANKFVPEAFYIVDSFGMMKSNNLIRFFYMIEHNLHSDISIGFHSHNNMQLSYSNAQILAETRTNRKIIIDASVHGMGRGAGNLNTELFVEHLNENFGAKYRLKPLLNIIDEILSEFYAKKPWGYSLPNYLSAKHNIHPNYANYLSDKNTLTVEDMDNIFSLMEEEKSYEFDKEYIENTYLKYMSMNQENGKHLMDFKNAVNGKKVLVIAPGKSSREKEKIRDFVEQNHPVTISVNFAYPDCGLDYVFVSNLRRFRKLETSQIEKCIVTSNISYDGAYLVVGYRQLINHIEAVRDNASIMLIKFLMDLGASEIYLSGVDGYSHDEMENYGDEKMILNTSVALLDKMNAGMEQILSEYKKDTEIKFLTGPLNIDSKIL